MKPDAVAFPLLYPVIQAVIQFHAFKRLDRLPLAPLVSLSLSCSTTGRSQVATMQRALSLERVEGPSACGAAPSR